MQSYWDLTVKLVLRFGRCSASCLFGSCALGPCRALQFVFSRCCSTGWLLFGLLHAAIDDTGVSSLDALGCSSVSLSLVSHLS